MGLLNYTTGVDADKTAAEIAKCLSMHGAKAIQTEYAPDGSISALSFAISVNGKTMGFRLPCDWKPVFEVMFKNAKTFSTHDSRYERQQSERRLQAIRTAWRIVKDWVEAQMALVETSMVRTEDVFLPYLVLKGGQTLSEAMKNDPNFLLPDGS